MTERNRFHILRVRTRRSGQIAEVKQKMAKTEIQGFIEEEVNPNRGILYMNEGVHAKLKLSARSADNKEIAVLLWNRGSYIKEIEAGKNGRDLIVRGLVHPPEINRYNGSVSYQLKSRKTECLYR